MSALIGQALTLPLRDAIAKSLPDRPFNLKFWDGSKLDGTSPDGPLFTFAKPTGIGHMVRRPGALGFFRGYVDGSLAIDDLDEAWRILDQWEAPPISKVNQVRLAAAAGLAAASGGVPKPPSLELKLDGEAHTVERDTKAISYHYDVGNEFFGLFLDEAMIYSCAIFSRGATTLEEAQRTKLDLIAKKLDLKPGKRLLDVGCGWGGWAIHAAKEYGVDVVAITLAAEQGKMAEERVAAAGLSDKIEIRVADYRSLSGEQFDAISSIGMVEHVGDSQIELYAETLAKMLKPGGLLLNHGIAITRPGDNPLEDPIVMRYVFPDGHPLPLWRIEQAMEIAGLFTQHIEGFQQDYADTLEKWFEKLDTNLPQAIALAGEERTRVWRIYLRVSKRAFEAGVIRVYQVLTRKPEEEPTPLAG